MLSETYHAQNYVGIIGLGLSVDKSSSQRHICGSIFACILLLFIVRKYGPYLVALAI